MKTVRAIAFIFCTWVVWMLVSQFLICARYRFYDPSPFEGNVIYNPYDSINPAHWVKCNFHAHARAWNGLTNGHGTAADVHNAYDSLKYGIHCVSNYHHIDTTNVTVRSYLPAYEHGYNTSKTHQLVLGGSHVQWLDYMLPQSVHNKQHILDQIREWGAVTVLNHPAIRNGYTEKDLAQLSNYDCMEVLSPVAISTKHWDAALSAGKKVFIVGNDDTHNVIDKKRVGEICTFANVPGRAGVGTLEALRSGRSFGVVIGKDQNLDSIPVLTKMIIKKDSVFVEMNAAADEIIVSGQDGRVLRKAGGTNVIAFRMQESDHYARTTFHYGNGTSIYLNPVFFTAESGYREALPFVNEKETYLFRLVGVVIMSAWLAFAWKTLGGNRRRQRFGQRKLVLR